MYCETRCSGVVVKKDLVSEDQYTGKSNSMLLIDITVRKVPIAKIVVDTPYFPRQVEAQCLFDATYDLIICNVPDARPEDDPGPGWLEACVVITRSQAKKAEEHTLLRVPSSSESAIKVKLI